VVRRHRALEVEELMTRPLLRHRARALAALAGVAGLGLAGAATVTAPAQSAAPAGDCTAAFPVDQLAAGDQVNGLTVTHGTEPEGFTGEVLGVLDDGIAPDVDMVMVRLSSPEIDRVGIWQGMSGSPVYAADGRLIGAVAYSLAMGSSTVAGVTPFSAMDDHLADAATTVQVGKAAARSIARGSDVSAATARQGFEQLGMPVGVAGVGAARLAQATAKAGQHRWLPTATYAAGRASAAAAGADSIVAGGNLAASVSYGDVTMGAIGTATSVCGDRVVGFGHPFAYLGSTTLGLHPADALYIQEDLVAGFKVANIGAPVGTITDDRSTGITGTLGNLPATTDVNVTVTKGDRTRTGVSHVELRDPDTLATTTFFEMIADHQAVVDGPVTGSEDLSWTVDGTDADGQPFSLSSSNIYSSAHDLTGRVGYETGDLVYRLAHVPGLSIDSITTSSDLGDLLSTYKVTGVEVRQQGTWVHAGRRAPVLARAGRTLVARVTLASGTDQLVLPVRLEVPTALAGKTGMLQVMGGDGLMTHRPPRTLDGLRGWLDQQVRNDQVQVSLGRHLFGGYSSGSMTVIYGRGQTPNRVTHVLGPIDGMAKGHAFVPVIVR
jgi:hypothetical protein